MSKRYNLKNIRALLSEGFSIDELRQLCLDLPEFRAVADHLTKNPSKAEIINRLLQHADQRLLFEPLLTWAREEGGLARYEAHQPYDTSQIDAGIRPDGQRKSTKDAVDDTAASANQLDTTIRGTIEHSTIIIAAGNVITPLPGTSHTAKEQEESEL